MPAELSALFISAYTTPAAEDALFLVVFTFVLPVIATIGLVGNIFSIIVLNNKDKFKSVIYIYLRGVALCDLAYMLLVISMCVVITISDYRQFSNYYMSWNPPGLEEYIWNFMPPLLNAIGSLPKMRASAAKCHRVVSSRHKMPAKSWFICVCLRPSHSSKR